ncbi:OmpA family protein [Haloactinospora alba]|uniref:OmpA family protein n=1 Tax=Haloactinospora alba TaxID=405555 RepID=A0A543NGE7_9ACTN|nr:OmpA family protein [Haloactinospora alba]TQN30926.1 OmpA family protein [Haloactinospora alba]
MRTKIKHAKNRSFCSSKIKLATSIALVPLLISGCFADNNQEEKEGKNKKEENSKNKKSDDSIAGTDHTYLTQHAQLDITNLHRIDKKTTILNFELTNKSNEEMDIYSVFAKKEGQGTEVVTGVSLIDTKERKQYLPWQKGNEDCYCSNFEEEHGDRRIPAGETWDFWAAFPSPPQERDQVSVGTPITPPLHEIPIKKDGEIPEEFPKNKNLENSRILDLRGIEENEETGNSRDETGEEVSVRLSSDVLFDVEESKLTSKADDNLKQVAKEIDESNAEEVKIDGYTDNTGNDSINDPLSKDRAESVEEKLEKLVTRPGIEFDSEGHGSSNPVADNNTEEGREKNRRTTVTFEK